MKNRYLLGIVLLVAGALPTFAQFSGTVSDSQGVQYTANDDESNCYVSGHEENYSATIEIPEVYEGRSVTSIGSDAFGLCRGLTSLTIPSSVTSIGHRAFYYCSGLTSVTIHEGVTSIDYFAFEGCSGLTSLTIPSSVTAIENCAFIGCSGLTSIIVEEGNTIYDSRDNSNAIIRTDDNTLIAGCKNTVIPSSVTSIGNSAFWGCSGLTSVTIPSSVTSIGDLAFYNCSGLTWVAVGWSSPLEIHQNVFADSNYQNATLYVPNDMREAYESADVWRGFGNISKKFDITDGTLSDLQGLQFTANNDESTCYVSGHNDSYRSDIIIPSYFRARQVISISASAFAGCSELTSLTVSWETPIEIDVSVFNGSNYQNATLYVSKGSKTAYEAVDVWQDFGDIKEKLDISDGAVSDSQGIRYTANDDESTCYVSGHDNTYSSDIIIPRMFKGRSVTLIGNDAFQSCSGLTSLTIPSSVTSIGNWAFSYCSGLTSIIVEEGNTVYDSRDNCNAIIKTADNTLIAGCKNTVIPSSVTSIGGDAFSGCSGLTSVSIPEGVTSIGDRAFDVCSSLTSVTIPEGVTSIGGDAFSGCSGLTSVSIPSSVTSISFYAFNGCTSLTSVIVGWETPFEIDGSVFSNSNYNNATLYVPKGTKAAYESADVWKDFGSIVEKLDISDGAVSDSQGIRYTANDDESTCYVSGHDDTYSSDIIIPRTFKGRHVTSIGAGAFSGCSDLTSLTVKWGTPIAIDGSVFENSNCHNAVLRVPIGSKAAYDVAEGWNDFGEIVEVFTEGRTSDSQGVIYLAYYDDELKCRVVGHEDTYSSTIIIPEFYKGSRVTSIDGSAFQGCSGLASVTIPSSVTSIADRAFSNCNALASIIVEDGNPIYDSRDNCNAIVRTDDNMLIAGCKNTVIPTSVTAICDNAFYGCSGLTSVTIPSSVTSIGGWAFYNCRGLTSLTIPESVTLIGRGAFRDCSGLSSLSIPSSVTSIGELAFEGCNGLTSVTIPSSVSSIGSNAFTLCSGLTSLIVGWDTPLEINSNIFSASIYNNATLYVPKGTKAAYEAAAVWQDFGAIFEGDLPQENVELTDASAIDNVIYIEPFDAMKGTEVTVSLRMKNTAEIRGFQFDMYLPLGVTVKMDGNDRFICSLNDNRKPSGDQHTLTVSEQQDGAIRFLCGSQYDETFTGTEGVILTVQLCLDEKMLAGKYPIILKNVKLTETNINNYYLTETVQTALNVIQYIPGDISGDGVIDVSDYIGVANYILGTPQEGIITAAADVNKDNLVDVSDYIGVANLILYNNIYGQTVSAARSMGRRRVNTDVSTLDNVIYISPLEAASNGETQVSIRMKNTVGIRGFQFDLYLPEGMTAVKDGNNRYVSTLSSGRKPAGDQHTLTLSEQPDGAIRFLCGSQYDETFTGTDGEIATLTISIAANVEVADYPIYLRSMKLTETDINNFYTTNEIETSVTVTGPADGRVVLRETATSLPVVDETEEVDVVVYRTLKAGEWSTICLPFDMDEDQVKAIFGDEVQLAKYSNYSTTKTGLDVTGISISFTAVDLADDGFEANVPYIIKPSKTEDITSFELTTMVAPDDVKAGSNKKGWFYGTYAAETVVPEHSLFLSGNKFYYSTGLTKMKAFRAYLLLPEHLADAASAASRIRMSYDDETTSVKELKSSRIEELKSCYNLKGQRVEKPVKKGVYIRDGKKVVVK